MFATYLFITMFLAVIALLLAAQASGMAKRHQREIAALRARLDEISTQPGAAQPGTASPLPPPVPEAVPPPEVRAGDPREAAPPSDMPPPPEVPPASEIPPPPEMPPPPEVPTEDVVTAPAASPAYTSPLPPPPGQDAPIPDAPVTAAATPAEQPQKASMPASLKGIRRPSSSDVEELVGTQVFLKAGVAIVVIGMVYFLAYAMGRMNPMGKVLLGYAVGTGMLAAGLYAERLPRYLSFGRGLIAGGFGVAYFVAFAMHFIPAARVIESPVMGIAAMLMVGAAAVTFSLRYRHEWTTIFAFFLALLALGLAAMEPDAAYNLAATTLVGAGVAGIGWRMGWHRLLSMGTTGTWVTVAIWMLPVLEGREEVTTNLGTSLLQLSILWLMLQAAIAFPARDDTPKRERWLTGTMLTNMTGAVGLGIYTVWKWLPGMEYLAALVFGILYLAQAWSFSRQERRTLYLVAGTAGLGCLALVSPLRLGFADRWVPVLRLFGIEVVLAAGIWIRERYFRLLAYLAFGITCIQLLALGNTVISFGPEVDFRAMAWGIVAALSLLNVALFARRWGAALSDMEAPAVPYAFTALGTFFMTGLIFLTVPPLWIGATLALLAAFWAGIARLFGRLDFTAATAFLAVAAVATLLDRRAHLEGVAGFTEPATLGAALVAAGLYIAYGQLLRPRTEGIVSGKPVSILGAVTAALAWLALTIVLVMDVPNQWAGMLLALSAMAHNLGALKVHRPELPVMAAAHTFAAGIAVMVHNLFVPPSAIHGQVLPILAALTLLFISYGVLRRAALGDAPSMAWIGKIDDPAPGVPILEFLCLALPTGLLLWFLKLEAVAYDKNLIVAGVWAVLGLGYLETGHRLRAWGWAAMGNLVLAVAVIHLYSVNIPHEGDFGAVSLRLVSTLPLLGILIYAYLNGKRLVAALPADYAPVRYGYFYVTVFLLATLLLLDLHRAWVVTGWAVLGLLLLWRWRGNHDLHWRLAAVLLGIATVLRGLTANLHYRDMLGDFRLNLLVIPLACLALLGGYLLTRREELDHPDTAATYAKGWEWLGWGRMSWLFACLILATGFAWVESEGTLLTVFLSIEALLVVALGFWMKERTARLAGMGMLCFCVLKLFVYDMRGLTGLPRIASFVVLGMVLISVSYTYTRYKERLHKLL